MDILIAAVSKSFSEIFIDRKLPVIHLVDNVAEHLQTTLEATKSIAGHFDIVYPICLAKVASSIPDLVAQARACRASSMSSATTHMVQSYSPEVIARFLPEIAVRYFDDREPSFRGTVLEQVDHTPISSTSGPPTLIPACISIMASRQENGLAVVVAHSWDTRPPEEDPAMGPSARGNSSANYPRLEESKCITLPLQTSRSSAWTRMPGETSGYNFGTNGVMFTSDSRRRISMFLSTGRYPLESVKRCILLRRGCDMEDPGSRTVYFGLLSAEDRKRLGNQWFNNTNLSVPSS